jgi:major membrane immunogen (membrane-anchored lipoprotein)
MKFFPRLFVFVLLLLFSYVSVTQAAPMFARQYGLSCVTCHTAFPELNDFGKQFADNNYRLSNWKDSTVKTGDDALALPAYIPIAVRAQAFVQARDAEAVDVVTGETTEADSDFQAPYLIKILSSAPLSDHISYYFYGIFAEKGGNGEAIIEDAWFSHDDVFGSGVGLMLGQFQVSDLMFPRETRLTFQDYMVYRMAGITYERGVIFDRGFGVVDVGIGLVNGNGIEENFTINSPGYRRSDHLFDNDNGKAAFIRIGADIGPVATGLFAYAGEQKNAVGDAGTQSGTRDTDKNIVGLDVSGKLGAQTRWFAQILWNEWDGFIDPNINYKWFGMFAGANYVAANNWSYSLLYNYADGKDFDNTDTVFEGIDINSLSFNASYYFMRNVKGVLELNYDFLDEEAQTGTYYTGHLTKENYFLVGFDAAY